MRCYASCSFGIESVTARELKELHMNDVQTRDGRVYFNADEYSIASANIWLRSADRVYIVLGEFKAYSYQELFEHIRAINFKTIIPSDAKIPVNGNAVKSKLMSVSDIQAVSKKAIADNLCQEYNINSLPETGSKFNIFINILNDVVTVALNTSGAGLNRRGYRTKNVAAPLRESLAAALVLLSRWKDHPFYDPMCGGGTIAIEAAMIAANIAPGLNRSFDAQRFNNELKKAFKRVKDEAQSSVRVPNIPIFASDNDKYAVEITQEHAKNAGVLDYIVTRVEDFNSFNNFISFSTLITNPPYSIRLGDKAYIEKLYREMGNILWNAEELKFYILNSNDNFERLFGHNADKRRKLYNGNIRCTYYQYFKNR